MTASAELRARLGGRRVIASVSGGKDSAAMSLWLMEQGIEHERVFADTGWEHEKTYEYLRGPLTAKLGPITEIRGPMLMEELVRHKGMFPSKQRRYCTTELKTKPLAAHIKARAGECGEVINAVGIRAAESEARSRMLEWEFQEAFDCDVWRPIVKWSEQDVIDIHARHGLPPNPLYLLGARRVGCFPCIMSTKTDLRVVAEHGAQQLVRLRVLEKDVTALAQARAERTGVPMIIPIRTWFQAFRGRTGMWPIDEVLAWAKTSHGGAVGQEELFALKDDSGCMRWGMCEPVNHDVSSPLSVEGARS